MTYTRAHQTYDPKCGELADHFLAEYGRATSDHGRRLAMRLQEAIEEFVSEEGLDPDDDYDPVREHGLGSLELFGRR